MAAGCWFMCLSAPHRFYGNPVNATQVQTHTKTGIRQCQDLPDRQLCTPQHRPKDYQDPSLRLTRDHGPDVRRPEFISKQQDRKANSRRPQSNPQQLCTPGPRPTVPNVTSMTCTLNPSEASTNQGNLPNAHTSTSPKIKFRRMQISNSIWGSWLFLNAHPIKHLQ